ncbi:unnamed protein product [Rhizophagus irregularis]|nr:unnamed protein product [Rhizophagus irregularis]
MIYYDINKWNTLKTKWTPKNKRNTPWRLLKTKGKILFHLYLLIISADIRILTTKFDPKNGRSVSQNT